VRLLATVPGQQPRGASPGPSRSRLFVKDRSNDDASNRGDRDKQQRTPDGPGCCVSPRRLHSRDGLQTPISVKSHKGVFTLIAGRHRIEAIRKLGKDRIEAIVSHMNERDARMWEICAVFAISGDGGRRLQTHRDRSPGGWRARPASPTGRGQAGWEGPVFVAPARHRPS
jgi:ParB-like nuclease domain